MALRVESPFQVGQAIGGANSPASGIGQVIRSILDKAKAKGLLDEQLARDKELATHQGGISRENLITQSAEQGKQTRLTAEEKRKNTPLDSFQIIQPDGTPGEQQFLKPGAKARNPVPSDDPSATDQLMTSMIPAILEKFGVKGEGETPTVTKPLKGAPEPQFATNQETGERIVSNDGGKTWQPVR